MKYSILILSILFGGTALADDLNCENKVVAVYSPGPNWSQLQQVLPAHLKFVSARLSSGDMYEAGPFVGARGPTGGFMVYNSEDTAAVEQIVKLDPFVAKKVSTYELRTWMKCTAPETVPAPAADFKCVRQAEVAAKAALGEQFEDSMEYGGRFVSKRGGKIKYDVDFITQFVTDYSSEEFLDARYAVVTDAKDCSILSIKRVQ